MDIHFTIPFSSRIHVGITGSIAAYKALDLIRSLVSSNIAVGATTTDSALEFITPTSLASLGANPVFSTLFESRHAFPHLSPMHEADVLLICPATANIIAKAAHGLADDLLSTQILSFKKQCIIAPAMNPAMWSDQTTQQNVQALLTMGCNFVQPESGSTACKDIGQGRLADVSTIYYTCLQGLFPQRLKGAKVLITAGPTREYWDCVRFWSNPSSGLMGLCLGLVAWFYGAEVHFVHGPLQFPIPALFHSYPIQSAQNMYKCCRDLWKSIDIGIFSAAVSDHYPTPYGNDKFKKHLTPSFSSISFEENPDILQTFGSIKTDNQIVVGFAAEAHNLLHEGHRKLQSKQCDLLLANSINTTDSGFCSSTNRALLISDNGVIDSYDGIPKTDLALSLWNHVLCFKK